MYGRVDERSQMVCALPSVCPMFSSPFGVTGEAVLSFPFNMIIGDAVVVPPSFLAPAGLFVLCICSAKVLIPMYHRRS